MAFPRISHGMPLALLFSLSLLLPSALGGIIVCEDLPRELCAFAISATSKRCLLESIPHQGGRTEYQCRTSEAVAERMSNWIETDDCVKACGIDRSVIGISSDSLLEPQFTAKLCSVSCYQNCPNIIDLYVNLAAGEGVFLPDLCKAQRVNPRRALAEFLSSGVAAPGPEATGSSFVAGLDAEAPLASAPSPFSS